MSDAFQRGWGVVKWVFSPIMDECSACGKQGDRNYTSKEGNWRMCWNCNDLFCTECIPKNISNCAEESELGYGCEDTFCNHCLSITTHPKSKQCQGCIDNNTSGEFRGDFRALNKAWGLAKMPVIPGSLKQTRRDYEYGHPKRKMGFGPNPVEEGDESESDHFWYEARHTEDPQRSKWPPIDVSIQNYTDAWESTRPREGREMALSGSMGELFAYRDRDGNYRVYDGSLLSQGEGETAANQIAGWNEEGPLFDGYDTRFGKDAAPGWNRPDETPKRMSRRMEMLEVLATILSHAHPDAKLFPYRGKTPVAPNPKLLGGDLE